MNVAVAGPVDAGKSTLIGSLSNNVLDDGNGKCRALITNIKHELTTGRTSTVNTVQLTKDDQLVTLIDLAGHEDYLKTTIRGLNNYMPKCAIIAISANHGLDCNETLHPIAIEHLSICTRLNRPVIFVITKSDLSPSDDHMAKLVKEIRRVSKEEGIRHMIEMQPGTNNHFVNDYFMHNCNIAPLVKISSKSGLNLDYLKDFIFQNANKGTLTTIEKKLFIIYRPFFVNGIGWVAHGQNRGSTIKKNDKLKLGPHGGVYFDVRVWSIHDDLRNDITEMLPGMTGCLAIKPIGKHTFRKSHFCGGKVVTESTNAILIKKIKAKIEIVPSHGTITIKKRYQPTFVCDHICAPCQVDEIHEVTKNNSTDPEKKYLCNDEAGIVTISFTHPQHIVLDKNFNMSNFLLYDGKVRACGEILS